MGLLFGTRRVLVASLIRRHHYYVDSIYGNDSYSGTQRSKPWQTLARVNAAVAEELVPTALVRLQRDQMWREQLTAPFSGASGNPIRFGAYGSGSAPILNGSDIITGWGADGGSYVATVTTEPNIVFYDNTRLTENDGATNTVGANEWDWNATSLWVNVGEDPDIGTLEATERTNNISAHGLEFLTFENLHWTRSRGSGFHVANAVAEAGLIISNCEASWNGHSGILVTGVSDMTISDMTSHHNVEHGIYVSGEDDTVSDLIIERCSLYTNGEHGIQFNANGVARIPSPIIRTCHIYGNISIEVNDSATNGARYINNIIRDAGTATTTLYLGWMDGDEAFATINAELYHNTFIVGAGARGINVGYRNTGNLAKNNIVHAASGASLIIGVGKLGELEGGLISDNNQFELDAADWIYNWRGSWRNSLAAWQGDSGQDANSSEGDPLFVNLANDWHLQAGSPCRGAGATGLNVPRDYDDVLRGSPPDIGALEYVA